MKIEVQNVKHGLRKLMALDPTANNSEAIRLAMTEMMTLVIDTAKQTQLSGPYPRELRQITGELYRSMEVGAATPTGISGGTSIPWAPVHEFGRGGKKSFLEPALNAVDEKFAEITERHLLAAYDAA